MRIAVTRGISIDADELDERFVRASGPGGQNVNKVSTAVELRFDVANSPSLPDEVKARLADAAGARLTRDGVLVLFAQSHRSQDRNREDARARLFAMIEQAAIRPVRRRPTKRTWGSQLRRLEGKSRRADVKRGRGDTGED